MVVYLKNNILFHKPHKIQKRLRFGTKNIWNFIIIKTIFGKKAANSKICYKYSVKFYTLKQFIVT